MTPYPLHTGERAAVREQIRTKLIERAEREALFNGRTARCSMYDDHARMWTPPKRDAKPERVGCANDGTTCICTCHDGGA